MLITKIITMGLDIHDPVSIYSDAASGILSILTRKLEGKCFRECLVRSVNKILHVSECKLDSRGASCVGKIAVTFEVTAVVHMPGEILNGCVIKRKENSIIMGVGADQNIIMKPHKIISDIKVGQIIPVVVSSSLCTIGENKISVSAVPFVPTRAYTYYYIKTTLDNAAKAKLESTLAVMRTEEELYAAVKNRRGLDFFGSIVQAAETQTLPHGAVKKTITELITAGTFDGVYARDKNIKITTPSIYEYAEKLTIDDPNGTAAAIEAMTPTDAITMLIHDYISGLRFIRELNETYSTDELLKSHANLFRIFKSS